MADTTTAPRSEAVAKLKFARMGPRKLRRVADAIRGKRVAEALTLLQFAGVYAAEPMVKLLKSAVANAENNHDLAGELYITRVMVDGGPGGGFTKRLDPRAQGRAAFKRKRMSHVTIAVGPTPPATQPKRRPGASVAVASSGRRRPASPAPSTSRRKKQPAAAAAGAAE